MENDSVKFKIEFKKRLYSWVLKLIKFLDQLPKGNVSEVMGKQLLRSGTSILANYVEANSASSKRDFINFFNLIPILSVVFLIILLNQRMNQKFG